MEIAILVGITLLNLAISWWNAKVVGEVWLETKMLGGFIRLVVWSAAIMSAIGFSSVYLLILTFGVASFLEAEQAQLLVRFAFSLWYLLVIVPVLATGLIITIHSWIEAYREPGLLNMGVAGWNTFAQLRNTANAVSGIGPALSEVGSHIGSALDGGDANSKVIRLGLVLVLVAFLLGALTTAVIVRRYEGTLPLPEDMDKELAKA